MTVSTPQYDLILVGSSFASSFFLKKFLEKKTLNPANKKISVLVLEKGSLKDHAWQREHFEQMDSADNPLIINPNTDHRWVSHILFGGNSNCWWASTPRMLPNDFELRDRYGIGVNWPIRYQDLEPYYTEAENIMSVSGSANPPYPMSRPYPQPPHRLNDTDLMLQKKYPQHYFPQPTARRRRAVNRTPACCANGVCTTCPIDAKFTILNSMEYLYKHPGVDLQLESDVVSVITNGNQASGVIYRDNQGVEKQVYGELIALGANALFNAQILMRSNMQHKVLGRYLSEQVSFNVNVSLDGLDNFQGSTSITGQGYMYYDGPHRKHRAACLIENYNTFYPLVRTEEHRWQQAMFFKCIFEDIPMYENHISLSKEDPSKVEIHYRGHSVYTENGITFMREKGVGDLLEGLPFERYTAIRLNSTECHIMGTHRMGSDPSDSIVDDKLLHHQYRNLLVLGSGTFPSTAPANPTLTISALSLRAADHLL